MLVPSFRKELTDRIGYKSLRVGKRKTSTVGFCVLPSLYSKRGVEFM